jgi:hypothetical protein
MSDLYNRVTSDRDFVTQILAKVPGFKGYIERSSRRASDKLLREYIADQFHNLEQRISSTQTEMIGQGYLENVDKLESAAIKIRQFTDRIRRATYGYGSLFAAVKINEEELASIYQYDLAMLALTDEIQSAIDNVEASIGTEGFPASVRHLSKLAQQAVDAFNRRSSIITIESDIPE